MKRTICLLLAALLAGLFVVSCAATSGGSTGSRQQQIVGAEGEVRPGWVRSRPQGSPFADTADAIYFIGRGTSNQLTGRSHAEGDALGQLSRWKDGVVASTLKRYVEEYGEMGNTQTLIGLENAIVSRAKSNTAGYKEVEYWIDQNGNYIGLWIYPKNDLRGDFRNATNTFVRNQAAAFAEFKADQSFRLLESELDKPFNP